MNEQNQRDSIMSMARGAFEERVDYEICTLYKKSQAGIRKVT